MNLNDSALDLYNLVLEYDLFYLRKHNTPEPLQYEIAEKAFSDCSPSEQLKKISDALEERLDRFRENLLSEIEMRK